MDAHDYENRFNYGLDHEHDQLPSSDELKIRLTPKQRNERKYQLCGWTLIAFVLAGVVFTAGIVIGGNLSANSQTAADVLESSLTGAAPHDGDVTSPDNYTDVEEATPEEERLIDVLVGVLNFGFIGDRTTPQYLAAQWLANFDPMALPVDLHSLEFRQRYALAVLYFSTHGREWLYPMKFLSGLDVCQWNSMFRQEEDDKHIKLGVDCDCAPGDKKCNPKSVKRIMLDSMGLRGSIPPQISLLEDLVELSLYKNAIEGPLPEEMTNLSHLQVLDLHHNDIDGALPQSAGNWKSLQVLNLASNNITGTFPSSMSRMTSLQVLNLNNNYVTGPLLALKGLTSLQALFLQRNIIADTFPNDLLDSWRHIEVIDVSNNYINGALPGNLFQHPTLTVLDLHGNMFTGILPKHASSSSPLTMLTLHETDLAGPLPSALGQLKMLEHLDLSASQYTGTIPDEFSQLVHLKYLSLAFNPRLTEGDIPSWLPNLTNLVTLSLQQSARTGFIPYNWDPLDHMITLDLADNGLQGPIPPGLSKMDALERLLLHQNTLTGLIPQSIVQLDLHTLTLQQNQIGGSANIVCEPKLPHLEVFISDCSETPSPQDEFQCSCCSTCCHENENVADCVTNIDNEDEFYGGDSNPVWDNEYVKDHFRFHDSESLHPLDYTDATQAGTFPLDETDYLENGALAPRSRATDAVATSDFTGRALRRRL